MKAELLDQVVEELSSCREKSTCVIHNGVRTTLDPGRFIPIEPCEPGTIGFVDGGNAPVLTTPSQSVQLCRTCAIGFDGPARTSTERESFFLLTTIRDNTIELKGIGHEMTTTISLRDGDLATGKHQVTLQACVELGRMMCEKQAAGKLARTIGDGGLIVMDGDFSRRHPILQKAENELRKECKEQGAKLIGFAKTITGTTDTGESITAAIQAIAPPGRWTYPLEFDGEVHRAITRLHPSSKHCFLIESFEQIGPTILSRLAGASNDLSFPGYPFGLVAADQLARVSNSERDGVAVALAMKTGSKNPGLIFGMRGSDAHDILDRM